MATLPEQYVIEDFGFSKKIVTSDVTGSRNMYMSTDAKRGFSRNQNLHMQLCEPSDALSVLFDVSEPKQGNPSRWGLDIEIPTSSSLYAFLVSLNQKARDEISSRANECFPALKVDKMSDDQLNMCMYPVFKVADQGGQNGRFKVKIIMPPTEEEIARLSKSELEKRQNETTKVFEVQNWEPPSAENPDGIFEHTISDASILKGGCKVMPIVSTTGVWMSKSNCGVSFICTSICVWKAPETSGVGMFNLGGVRSNGIKRKHPELDTQDEVEQAYSPYHGAE